MSGSPMNGPQAARRRNGGRLLAHIAVVIGVAAIAVAAFALSYRAVRDIALAAGVPATLARLYPAILDAVFVVACAAALTLREARWWARGYTWLSVLVTGALIGAAAAYHAMGVQLPRKVTAGIVAALPLALVVLGFSLWLSMLRHGRAGRTEIGEDRLALAQAAPSQTLAIEAGRAEPVPAALPALPAPSAPLPVAAENAAAGEPASSPTPETASTPEPVPASEAARKPEAALEPGPEGQPEPAQTATAATEPGSAREPDAAPASGPAPEAVPEAGAAPEPAQGKPAPGEQVQSAQGKPGQAAPGEQVQSAQGKPGQAAQEERAQPAQQEPGRDERAPAEPAADALTPPYGFTAVSASTFLSAPVPEPAGPEPVPAAAVKDGLPSPAAPPAAGAAAAARGRPPTAGTDLPVELAHEAAPDAAGSGRAAQGASARASGDGADRAGTGANTETETAEEPVAAAAPARFERVRSTPTPPREV